MPEDIVELLRGLGRSLGQVSLNTVGPVVNGQRHRQMVKRRLPDEANQVFRGIKAGRVHRRVEKIHGDSQDRRNFRQHRR